MGFAQKDPGRIDGKNISRAKAQSRKENPPKTRQRFASLRLSARNVLGKKHFLCKAHAMSPAYA
jgi:hypothetical protein